MIFHQLFQIVPIFFPCWFFPTVHKLVFNTHGIKPIVSIFELDDRSVGIPCAAIPLYGNIFQCFHKPTLNVPRCTCFDCCIYNPFSARNRMKPDFVGIQTLHVRMRNESSLFWSIRSTFKMWKGAVRPSVWNTLPA